LTSSFTTLQPATGLAASSPYRGWIWLNILSLDAPIVALLWQALFSRCLHVQIRWPAIVALALSTWMIYAVDRLLDGRSPGASSMSLRHKFSSRHRTSILTFVSLAVACLLWTCQHLKAVVFQDGVWMLGAVAVYFAIVHFAPPAIRRLWPKEVAVGVLFALGTCLATWALAGRGEPAGARPALIAPALLFAALCSLNCMAIEVWECGRTGKTSPIHPLTAWVGARVQFTALAIAALALVFMPMGPLRPLFVAGFLSAASFVWLGERSDSLPLNTLRLLADAALLSPLVLLAATS
jgi:hypothetical protein